MDPHDADLVRRFQKGDSRAASALVKKYTKITIGLVYSSIGRVQDVEDLVQEVFLEAQKSVKQIRNPDRFSSWLYKITQRVCNRWLRDHRRAPTSLEVPEEIQGPQLPEVEGDVAAHQIRETVDGMPTPLREVVYLRYFQNLSYDKMGELLGISPSAVNARLMKARRLLKSRITSRKD